MDLKIRRGSGSGGRQVGDTIQPITERNLSHPKRNRMPPSPQRVGCGSSMVASQRTCGRRGWKGEAEALVVGGQPPDVKEKKNYNNNNKRNRRSHKGENRYEK